jgi:hypothetical protein
MRTAAGQLLELVWTTCSTPFSTVALVLSRASGQPTGAGSFAAQPSLEISRSSWVSVS